MKRFAIIDLVVSLPFAMSYFASVNHGREALNIGLERVSGKDLRELGLPVSEITSPLKPLMEARAPKFS